MKRDNKIKHLKHKIWHIEHINKNIVSDKNFKRQIYMYYINFRNLITKFLELQRILQGFLIRT